MNGALQDGRIDLIDIKQDKEIKLRMVIYENTISPARNVNLADLTGEVYLNDESVWKNIHLQDKNWIEGVKK